jgi:ubiquinone/menaquinone biosynthesis C-methylase UbiE
MRFRLGSDVINEYLFNSMDKNIIDVGCGLGEFTEKMAAIMPENRYFGTDISSNAIKFMKKKFPYVNCTISALPNMVFRDYTFDLVTALEVIYYLDESEREKSFLDIGRIVKDNGYFMFSGPLDSGTTYFNEKTIINQAVEVFDVERIEYLYLRYYSKIEKKLFRIYREIGFIKNEIMKQNKPKGNRKEHTARYRIKLFFKTNIIIRMFINCFCKSVEMILYYLLSIYMIPWLANSISRIFAPERTKSLIIVMMKKRNDSNIMNRNKNTGNNDLNQMQ